MTSSSDFSPMYASTSSINCERTRAVNHRFVSRPSFILSLSSSSAFNQSNPIQSQTEKVNPPPLGVRVVLCRARANSSSSSSSSSSSVTHPSRVPLPWARPYPPPPPFVPARCVASRCRVFIVGDRASPRSSSTSSIRMYKQYMTLFVLKRGSTRRKRKGARDGAAEAEGD